MHDRPIWNETAISGFDKTGFTSNVPCPWWNFSDLIDAQSFESLIAQFPSLDLFEKHQSIPRLGGQRPHDRYYLALGQSVYGARQSGARGLVQPADLGPAWQRFIDALYEAPYKDFVQDLLGIDEEPVMRFAWHVAEGGQDVSPHVDSTQKIGTHIFYFNTSEDWSPQWGGGTAFYCGKLTDSQNPEPSDFESRAVAQIVDNRSVLFRNADDAWHGVEEITCPRGVYRKIFNVIFEHRGAKPKASRFGKLRSLFRR